MIKFSSSIRDSWLVVDDLNPARGKSVPVIVFELLMASSVRMLLTRLSQICSLVSLEFTARRTLYWCFRWNLDLCQDSISGNRQAKENG